MAIWTFVRDFIQVFCKIVDPIFVTIQLLNTRPSLTIEDENPIVRNIDLLGLDIDFFLMPFIILKSIGWQIVVREFFSTAKKWTKA